ncbi:MAG: hypothetical protein U5J96_04740 [Ignavibacteriaceae bacterium]|nr:hypothetical protein [Ignavibacteriaceae bacterium]
MKLKFTNYFLYTKSRSDRKEIKTEWIERVINNPIKKETQRDGRIKLWGKINEVNKYLRIVLLDDNETVHNAFFDRNFKE